MIGTPPHMHHLLPHHLPFAIEAGHRPRPPQPQNPDLGAGSDDGRDVRATDAPDVADREGPAREILRAELSGSGEGAQAGDLGGDLQDGEGGGGFDVRDYETLGCVHCDADVYLVAHDQARLGGGGGCGGFDAGVEDGVAVEGEGESFDDEGEVGEFWVLFLFVVAVEGGAEAGEGGDVEFVGVEEVRDGEGAGHCFEHLGLDWGKGDWGLGLATGRGIGG